MTSPDPWAERRAAYAALEAHRKAIADDYSKWIAVVPIPHGTAIAYAPGHPVPDSNVKKYGYDKDGFVAPAGSPAARVAQGLPPEDAPSKPSK